MVNDIVFVTTSNMFRRRGGLSDTEKPKPLRIAPLVSVRLGWRVKIGNIDGAINLFNAIMCWPIKSV